MSYQAPPPSDGYGYGQPGGYGAPQGQPPANNLVWAILTTVFCCLPAGVVSIVYAAQVNGKWASGDVAGAQKASANAKRWAIISAAVGVVVIVLYVIFAVVLAGSNSSSDF